MKKIMLITTILSTLVFAHVTMNESKSNSGSMITNGLMSVNYSSRGN